MLDLTAHRENLRKRLLKESFDSTQFVGDHWPGGIYGDNAIVHIIEDDQLEEALKMLKHTANWFEHEHPTGRKTDQEPDFASIKLVMALFEKRCYDKLTDDIKEDLKRFFLKNNFQSVFASENHSLMFRASRVLAAQFYKGEYFEAYNASAEEIYERDTKYLTEFLNFRAGQSWGEFDSLGYVCEDFLILNTLYSYTDNPDLKNRTKMIMDLLFLDMIADSKGAIYGGAHGRSYPGVIHDRRTGDVAWLYSYFFGGEDYTPDGFVSAITLYSDYQPDEIVYSVVENRAFPYENYERKHLHSCYAWYFDDIKYDRLASITGSINKYTYVSEDYILGSVNRQTKYYADGTTDGYDHHQQHEWEFSSATDGRVKIFSHHPGLSGEHNRWTGDIGCCCGSFYTNKNTAVAMYNIEKEGQLEYINALCRLEFFDDKIFEDNYLFLEHGKLYISLYFSEGYRITQEGWEKNNELVSEGKQHAVVLRVEYKDKYESLAAFGESIKKMPVIFDKAAKTVKFDGIELRTDGNSIGGKENVYPYAKLYDCPFMQSEWDSKVIDVYSNGKKITYDFIRNKIVRA